MEHQAARDTAVSHSLRLGYDVLRHSRSASLDAQLLLAHALGRSRTWVLAHPSEPVPESVRTAYQSLIERRARGEPVAYLRGFVEWCGLDFEVTSDVLIPRPETELLAERAVQLGEDASARIAVDVGTGSGAIATYLAMMIPSAHVFATDVSAAALSVAQRNFERHGVADRVTPLYGRLLEPVTECPDLIVANLPYLSYEMMNELDTDVRFEPENALRAGPSGLEIYEEMFDQLLRRGCGSTCLIEIDPRQSENAVELVDKRFPNAEIQIIKDYAGFERILTLRT